MSKAEQLMKSAGANVNESMGVGRTKMSHGATELPMSGPPTRYQGIKKAADAAVIPVDRIQPDPDQPRKEFDDEAIERLADGLKTRGQLSPIRVRWDDQSESYIIICGERRWRAAVRASLGSIDCMVHTKPLTRQEIRIIQMMENVAREDLNEHEKAMGYRALMDDMQCSARELAKHLSVHHSSVSRALALLDLPESVQSQVLAGTIKPSVAYEMAKLGDAETIEQVATAVATEGLTRAEAVERVQAAQKTARAPRQGRGAAKAKAGPPKPRTFRLAGGKVILEPKKIGGPEAMLAMAEELVEQLRAELNARAQDAA